MQDKHSTEKIQFFTNIAHDLKTPLTLIKSPLMSLDSKDYINNLDKKLIQIALNNVDKLSNHFSQLLDFQKGELKKLQLQIDKHDIMQHLKKTVSYFEPLIEKKKLKIEIISEEPEIVIWYDRNKFDKVFYNLISNAIKYSKDNGKIEIQVRKKKNDLQIDFTDDGIGIPEKQQKDIFKRYYRASNAINSSETGSGVGLLLVKQNIDLHKGKVSFTSKENEGTCFSLKLLLGNKHFEASEIVQSPYIESKTSEKVFQQKVIVPYEETESQQFENEELPTMLIVDDSEEILLFLTNEFRNDFNILQASNGKIALEIVQEKEPDIIISDVMMPEMDGTTLCATLKENVETSHIPIILLTALASSETKISSYDLGADSYIEKPFDLRILRSKVFNLIKSRKILKDKFNKPDEKEPVVSYKNKLDNDFIQKAYAIVNKHMDNSEFSVEVLCHELFMSRPVVYRKLKALTNNSPQDFIKIIRLKKAAEFIKEERFSITDVAYNTGFSDPKYFSTSFKNFFGVSPSKYLKKDNTD